MIQATRKNVCAIIPAFGFFSSWTETANMILPKFRNFWTKQQLPRHTSSSEIGCGTLPECRPFGGGRISSCRGKSADYATGKFQTASAVFEWLATNCSHSCTNRAMDLLLRLRTSCWRLAMGFRSNLCRFERFMEMNEVRSNRCEIRFAISAFWPNTAPVAAARPEALACAST